MKDIFDSAFNKPNNDGSDKKNETGKDAFEKHMVFEMMGTDTDKMLEMVDTLSMIFNRFKSNGFTDPQAMAMTINIVKLATEYSAILGNGKRE